MTLAISCLNRVRQEQMELQDPLAHLDSPELKENEDLQDQGDLMEQE